VTATLVPFDESLPAWERALYVSLAEKERRSGSRRTVDGYSRMLQHFFGALGKPPDQITSGEVFTFAHGVGLSGKEPSAVTRLYHLTERGWCADDRPVAKVNRPREVVGESGDA
jgi:hypothetical protein